jgi:hypothetical protein
VDQHHVLTVGKLAAFTAEATPLGQAREPVETLSGVLAALLEVPALAHNLRRTIELAETISKPLEGKLLPNGVRLDVGRIAAALALAPSFAEMMRHADVVDFRDLNETEVAYLEGVSLKTVRRWRTQGTGPEYRCEAGISYPIRWLWEWRERGRQRMTAQKKTRGRRD